MDEASPRPLLAARLSIELYYEPPAERREGLSLGALEAGRRVGGAALLEALGARHVGLWGPDHVQERLGIADELVAAASGTAGGRRSSRGSTGVSSTWSTRPIGRAREAIDSYEVLAAETAAAGLPWFARCGAR